MLRLIIKHFLLHIAQDEGAEEKKAATFKRRVWFPLVHIKSSDESKGLSLSCRVEFAHTSGLGTVSALSAARPHTVFYLKTLRKGGTAIRHELPREQRGAGGSS